MAYIYIKAGCGHIIRRDHATLQRPTPELCDACQMKAANQERSRQDALAWQYYRENPNVKQED